MSDICGRLSENRPVSSHVFVSVCVSNLSLVLTSQCMCVTRDSKLTMLLRESLGNMNCRTTMIAHISASPRDFSETLSTIQIASRVLRMKKKKTKVTVVSFNQMSMFIFLLLKLGDNSFSISVSWNLNFSLCWLDFKTPCILSHHLTSSSFSTKCTQSAADTFSPFTSHTHLFQNCTAEEKGGQVRASEL